MQEEVFYVKSLERDFATKTLKGKNKITFQTIENIIKNKKIRLNTKSFGRKRRLSTTILHKIILKHIDLKGLFFKQKINLNMFLRLT